MAIAPVLLARRRPLEQLAAADEHSPMRAHDRVRVEPRFVWKAGERKGELDRAARRTARDVNPRCCEDRHVARTFAVARPAVAISGGTSEDAERDQRPPPGRSREWSIPGPAAAAKPAERDCGAGCRRSSTATAAKAGSADRSTGARNPSQQPPGDLPIAADPAVTAAHVGAVARRIVVVQLNVADERRAGVISLEEVVAQDAVLGKPPAERLLERVDVVDALADERTFAEAVLIDVGNDSRVRVDPRIAAEKAREPRPVGPRQARRRCAVAGCRIPRSPAAARSS